MATAQVTHDVMFELGFFVPDAMKNVLKKQSLKTLIRELKAHVEV